MQSCLEMMDLFYSSCHGSLQKVVSACSRQIQVWSKARRFLGYTIKPWLHFWLFLLSQRDLTNHFLTTRHWWGKQGRSVYVSGIHHAIGSIWVFVSWFISGWIYFCYVLNPFPGPLYLRLRWLIVMLAGTEGIVVYSSLLPSFPLINFSLSRKQE